MHRDAPAYQLPSAKATCNRNIWDKKTIAVMRVVDLIIFSFLIA